MSNNSRTKLIRARAIAYKTQGGHCFYCGKPMWLGNANEFTNKHGLSTGQAKYHQCTAEHLLARQDGGGNSMSNIVAACVNCNRGRHRRKRVPPPDAYKQFVVRRIARGRWYQ